MSQNLFFLENFEIGKLWHKKAQYLLIESLYWRLKCLWAWAIFYSETKIGSSFKPICAWKYSTMVCYKKIPLESKSSSMNLKMNWCFQKMSVFVSWLMANSLCNGETVNIEESKQLWKHVRWNFFCLYSSYISCNVSLSVGLSVCLPATSFIEVFCCC